MKNRKKTNKKNRKNSPIVIELNLSLTVGIIIAIITVIGIITTAKVVTTIIQGEESKKLSENDDNSRVTYVTSKVKDESGNLVEEVDDNGNVIKIPVPKGYSASQIDGETSINQGFVIYEGDIDWSTILVNTTETNETNTQSANIQVDDEQVNEEQEQESEAKNNQEVDEEQEQEHESEAENNQQANEEQEQEGEIENNQEVNNEQEQEGEIENNQQVNEGQEQENDNENLMVVNLTTQSLTSAEEEQQTKNIFELQKSSNQYVWIPVDDPSEIYGVDSNGKMWGKIYDFSGSGKVNRGWTETNGLMNLTDQALREPDVIKSYDKSTYDRDNSGAMRCYGLTETRYEMLTQELEQNYYEIIESIKKYGGFYIGRYETGGVYSTDKKITPVVRKMRIDIVGFIWYQCYSSCLKLKGNNDNVKTSLMYGSLWCETIDWLVKSGATTSDGTALTYSNLAYRDLEYGNFNDTTFKFIAQDAEMPIETEIKKENNTSIIPTGSAEFSKLNNIYDLAGNTEEWTIETSGETTRVCRGGSRNKEKSFKILGTNYYETIRANDDTRL